MLATVDVNAPPFVSCTLKSATAEEPVSGLAASAPRGLQSCKAGRWAVRLRSHPCTIQFFAQEWPQGRTPKSAVFLSAHLPCRSARCHGSPLSGLLVRTDGTGGVTVCCKRVSAMGSEAGINQLSSLWRVKSQVIFNT